MMEYKRYQATVEFDDQAGVFHGQVINTRDVITFQGKSVASLRSEFKASVEDYLAFCAARGEEPEKPFSGRFVLRMEPEQHRRIARASALAGVSLNAWVVEQLELCASARIERASGHLKATTERRSPRRVE